MTYRAQRRWPTFRRPLNVPILRRPLHLRPCQRTESRRGMGRLADSTDGLAIELLLGEHVGLLPDDTLVRAIAQQRAMP